MGGKTWREQILYSLFIKIVNKDLKERKLKAVRK